MLESAIPPRFQIPRTCPLRLPKNHTPPFPAYCARFPTLMTNLAMAIIGAQYPSKSAFTTDPSSISTIKKFMTEAPETVRPHHWDVASVTDKRGFFNIAVLAYWPSVELHKRWEAESGFQNWWNSLDAEKEGNGWFLEVLSPSLDRFETNFSDKTVPEGAAHMQERISGEMAEHGYWGSARDRLPIAQTDALVGEKWVVQKDDKVDSPVGDGGENTMKERVRVSGKKNLCVIRSGQDWSGTLPEERKLYLETMHPVLIEGMNFLRDKGSEIGCYSMNLMDVVDSNTYEADKERTFGLGYFDDIASLEFWSKSHPTHIKIFGGFLQYTKKLNNVLSLRLFHEVLVLEENQQSFEYVGCHEETGMMNCLRR